MSRLKSRLLCGKLLKASEILISPEWNGNEQPTSRAQHAIFAFQRCQQKPRESSFLFPQDFPNFRLGADSEHRGSPVKLDSKSVAALKLDGKKDRAVSARTGETRALSRETLVTGKWRCSRARLRFT